MLELASVLLLGIGAQWLAWKLRLPSILLLLLVGFVAGPFSGQRFLDPDRMLGESLLPLVSLAVALILLEGGLTLKFQELREAGSAVRNLVLVGSPVTFVLASICARFGLGVDWGLAFLIGSILIVTGPTVIGPLLRHVRPSGAVGSVVRWEGIVTDPIGAILAVLVFQALSIRSGTEATTSVLQGLLESMLVGGVLGVAGAGLLIFLLGRHLVPDFLHNPVSIALGLGSFVAADLLRHESGLVAVTVMGIVLANQDRVAVEHIIEFKENLRVLLISSLFILLAARLPIEEFRRFDLRTCLFVALLILVVRPVAALLSSIGTNLTFRERIFVCWMAPRGIVAAAVASVFGLELATQNYPDADRLVSVIFGVIIFTVAIYGLTAKWVARKLGIAEDNPQGVLLVGAHSWARDIAAALEREKIDVLLVDTNHAETHTARMAGHHVHQGSILSEDFQENVPLDGLGNLLCLTHNDEVNSLACLQFSSWLGRAHVFQLSESGSEGSDVPSHFKGRILFTPELHYWDLEARFRGGARVKCTKLTEEFNYDDFCATYDRPAALAVPLFVIGGDGLLQIVTEDRPANPGVGDTLIALVTPEDEGTTGLS